jgi:hypothetical protein
VISAIRLPTDGAPAKVVSTTAVEGTIKRLIAAQRQLFAVTLEGQILAFGEKASSAERSNTLVGIQDPSVPLKPSNESVTQAEALLSVSNAEGYAFWFGRSDSSIVEAISSKSPFQQFAIVDPDRDRVEALRRKLDAANLDGRVTVHCSEANAFRAPHYVAHMIFVGSDIADLMDGKLIKTLYDSVRPYGGTMQLLTKGNRDTVAKWVQSLDLEQAQIESHSQGIVVRRQGALPG